MSTRPDPERSGAAEIATRRCPRLRVVWDLCELTHQQKPRLWSLPARLGPVTVHPTRWGVGPRFGEKDVPDRQRRYNLPIVLLVTQTAAGASKVLVLCFGVPVLSLRSWS